MSWPVIGAAFAGLVVGINLGVLLMVALQAGRRQDEAVREAAMLARIQDLETTLASQSTPTAADEPARIAAVPQPLDRPGTHRVTG